MIKWLVLKPIKEAINYYDNVLQKESANIESAYSVWQVWIIVL